MTIPGEKTSDKDIVSVFFYFKRKKKKNRAGLIKDQSHSEMPFCLLSTAGDGKTIGTIGLGRIQPADGGFVRAKYS